MDMDTDTDTDMDTDMVHTQKMRIILMKSKMKSSYKNPRLIAEIGCNHKGEMSIAKDLLTIASQCGVEVAKFQKNNRYLQH